ncbi:MAG: hypothetical protein ACJ74M_10345 [Gaiellaceae bacterium]
MSASRLLLLVAAVAVASGAAVHASAAPSPEVFQLTLTGTATATWDYTSAPLARLECESSQRSVGRRTAMFRSTRPVLVRFHGGRVETVAVPTLSGTLTLVGANTQVQECAGVRTTTPESCPKSARQFANGRATLLASGPGRVTISSLRLSLPAAQCPREPKDAVASPLGPRPGPLRISTRALADDGIGRITLTSAATHRKHYGAPESGTITQRSVWKLTFVRVRP